MWTESRVPVATSESAGTQSALLRLLPLQVGCSQRALRTLRSGRALVGSSAQLSCHRRRRSCLPLPRLLSCLPQPQALLI